MPDETALAPTPAADEATAIKSVDEAVASGALETEASEGESEGQGANQSARDAVRFKGWRGGLLISIPVETDWEPAIAGLHSRMQQAREFWEGAPCTIDLASRELSTDALAALLDTLASDFDLSVVGVVSTHEAVRQAVQERKLEAHSELPVSGAKPVADDNTDDNKNKARYVRGTVRSGVVVEAPGHLVVLGDVNAGAEVRAGGDILVFGTLRGVAHAGQSGDLSACIQALNLRPTQLRIGELIARAPDGGQPPLSKFPEKAIVENGEIHVVPA